MIRTTFDQNFNLDPYIEYQLGYVPPQAEEYTLEALHDSKIDRKVRIFLERSDEYRMEYYDVYKDGKIYLISKGEEN